MFSGDGEREVKRVVDRGRSSKQNGYVGLQCLRFSAGELAQQVGVPLDLSPVKAVLVCDIAGLHAGKLTSGRVYLVGDSMITG